MKHDESELTESQLKDETKDGGNLFFALNEQTGFLLYCIGNKKVFMNDMSWSCYYPQNGKPCNICEPCKKREVIFAELNKKQD